MAGSPPEVDHGVAHGGQVDHGRHAGEVLHQDAGRGEGDLVARARRWRSQPASASMSAGRDGDAVLVAEHVFEENLERVGQAVRAGQRVEPEDLDSERPPTDRSARAPKLLLLVAMAPVWRTVRVSGRRKRGTPAIAGWCRPCLAATRDQGGQPQAASLSVVMERVPTARCQPVPRHPGRVAAPRRRGPHGPPGGLGGGQARPRRPAVRGPSRRRRGRAGRAGAAGRPSRPGRPSRRSPTCGWRAWSASPARWWPGPPRRSTPSWRPARSRWSWPSAEVLSAADVLPFPVERDTEVGEEARLRYRYLDLRRGPLAERLAARARLAQVVRSHLAERGFLEVQTPVLTASSPEGARDFLVPEPALPRRVLRPAAGPAAVQAAADGRRGGALLPDRPVLPGRGVAGRPQSGRVLPDRPRDGVRHPGGRVRRGRAADGADREGVLRQAGAGRLPPAARSRRPSTASGPTSPTCASSSRSPT